MLHFQGCYFVEKKHNLFYWKSTKNKKTCFYYVCKIHEYILHIQPKTNQLPVLFTNEFNYQSVTI